MEFSKIHVLGARVLSQNIDQALILLTKLQQSSLIFFSFVLGVSAIPGQDT